MLGWFKKKFSKKKKQEPSPGQESVSEQEKVVAREDEQSVHGLAADDVTVEAQSDDVTVDGRFMVT